MTKNEFLCRLRRGLDGFPIENINEHIDFYAEMTEERMKEGISEEEAVAAIGDPEELAVRILSDIYLGNNERKRAKPKRRLRVWEIVFLAAGSPIWASLLVAASVLAVSLYASLWTVIISLWTANISIAVCAVVSLPVGIYFIAGINSLTGFLFICAFLVLAGLSIFLFFGCRAITRLGVIIIKRFILGIKRLFVRKEE